jgi:hypothetical protein
MTRVVAVSLVCAMAAVPGHPVERARTVSVLASFESDGQPVSQAVVPTAAQLSVSIAGKPATVESVSRVTARASILLLVDLTWTVTRGEHPAQAAEIGHLKRGLVPRAPGFMVFPGFIRGMDKALLPLLGPDDDLGVGSFAGQRLTFSRGFTSNQVDRLAAFKEVVSAGVVPLADWYGPSRMWDAVAAGATQFLTGAPFKSILLVTDGQSSGNRLSHAEAITAAVAQGVVVHVICQKSSWDPTLGPSGDTFVRRLAEQTGGLIRIDDVMDRDPWDKPARIFKDIVDAIHHTYEIRLVAVDAAEGIHALEVQTELRGLRVNVPAWVQVRTQWADALAFVC